MIFYVDFPSFNIQLSRSTRSTR